MPTVVGRDGAIKTYFLEMTPEEHKQISNCVSFLEKVTHDAIKSL